MGADAAALAVYEQLEAGLHAGTVTEAQLHAAMTVLPDDDETLPGVSWLYNHPEVLATLADPVAFLDRHLHVPLVAEFCLRFTTYQYIQDGAWQILTQDAALHLATLGYSDFNMLQTLPAATLAELCNRFADPDPSHPNVVELRAKAVGLVFELCRRQPSQESATTLLKAYERTLWLATPKMDGLRACWAHIEEVLAQEQPPFDLYELARLLLTRRLVQGNWHFGYVQPHWSRNGRVALSGSEGWYVPPNNGAISPDAFAGVNVGATHRTLQPANDGTPVFEGLFVEVWPVPSEGPAS